MDPPQALADSAPKKMMIEVRANPDDALSQEVTTYLEGMNAASGACGEHNPLWLNILRDGLKHKPYMLIAREAPGGPIHGYLPLALVASRLFGRFLVSLPYVNRAGVVAEHPAVATELINAAVKLAEEQQVKYLELRHHSNVVEHADLGMQRDEKVRMVLSLPETQDELWKTVNCKVRNQVRKADKNNLTIKWGASEVLDDFYNVFAINMRDLGTPVFSRGLFGSILKWMPDRAELAVVYLEDEPIAGALLIHDPGSTQVPSASTLRQHNKTNANMWMYNHLLNRAIERGSAEFDFGRSSIDSGTYRFKKQWGAKPQPTVWQYHVRYGDTSAMRPDNPKNQRRVETWKKLPVWLTKLAGPPIVRGIP